MAIINSPFTAVKMFFFFDICNRPTYQKGTHLGDLIIKRYCSPKSLNQNLLKPMESEEKLALLSQCGSTTYFAGVSVLSRFLDVMKNSSHWIPNHNHKQKIMNHFDRFACVTFPDDKLHNCNYLGFLGQVQNQCRDPSG